MDNIKYKFFGYRYYSVNQKEVIVCNENKTFKLPHDKFNILVKCKHYNTIQNHINNIYKLYKKNIFNKKKIQHDIKITISQLIREGLLRSEREIKNILKSNSPDSEQNIYSEIEVLGIPTKNRDDLLLRCINSYLDNLTKKNRKFTIIVADDSDGNYSDKSYNSVSKIVGEYDLNLIWANKNWRKKYSSSLSNLSGIDQEITDFALLGSDDFENCTGACRNTILLLSSGKMSTQVDDDTICRTILSPNYLKDLKISSKTDCNSYIFYKDEYEKNKDYIFQEKDYFSIHEELLGKNVSSLIANEDLLNIDDLEFDFFKKILSNKTRVAVTYTGALGDSGLKKHWWKLFLLNENSRKEMIQSKSTFQCKMRSRQQFRVSNQKNLSDGPYYMSMNLGLDSRYFLPPFNPILRNQDGPFSQLLYLGFNDICRGFMPWSVLHNPKNRPFLDEINKAYNIGPYQIPDIIDSIIWSLYSWPFGQSNKENTERVGLYLIDLSNLPLYKFTEKIRNICYTHIKNKILYYSEIVSLNKEPDYWVKDTKKVILNYEELIKQEDFFIPSELTGNKKNRLHSLQNILKKMGQLLMSWPIIWDAAVLYNRDNKIII